MRCLSTSAIVHAYATRPCGRTGRSRNHRGVLQHIILAPVTPRQSPPIIHRGIRNATRLHTHCRTDVPEVGPCRDGGPGNRAFMRMWPRAKKRGCDSGQPLRMRTLLLPRCMDFPSRDCACLRPRPAGPQAADQRPRTIRSNRPSRRQLYLAAQTRWRTPGRD